MEYVRNAWYVAGWSSEFANDLGAVKILDDNIVIYRTSKGRVIAMEDRCPHRFLPLSMGKLIGDNLQCGYHGVTYNCEGHCVRIPGQKKIQKTLKVRTYPVFEQHDIVWIWMGDKSLADTSEIFDMPQFAQAGWEAHQGDAIHLTSNYLNVAENLVDPAHVSFVHPTTLGSSASEDVPVHFDTSGDAIVAWRWIRDSPPIGFFKEFPGYKTNVDRWHYYYLYPPSIAVIDFGSADSKEQIEENQRHLGTQLFALHFLTPVSSNRTIDRWMHLRNVAVGDETASSKINSMFKVAFAEDKQILEAIQEQEDHLQNQNPVHISIDKGSIAYRRRIADLIKSEAADNSTM
jgi:vanillate O-demethylase monooxygenase subunit